MANLTFRKLNKLSNDDVQRLLCEIDQRDLIVALGHATVTFKKKVLRNMSERVRVFFTEELEYRKASSAEEVTEAQGRIVQKAEQLVEEHEINLTPGGASVERVKKSRVTSRSSKSIENKRKKLESDVHRRLDEMTYEQIDQMFLALAQFAKRDGILSIEHFIDKMDDSFLQAACRLVVDGTEPQLIMDLLETWLHSREHDFKVRHRKVIEGVMAIQAGENPRLIEHKLSVIY